MQASTRQASVAMDIPSFPCADIPLRPYPRPCLRAPTKVDLEWDTSLTPTAQVVWAPATAAVLVYLDAVA